jgi:hypothetical protein
MWEALLTGKKNSEIQCYDQANALAYYARQRDDQLLDIWMREMRLRAVIRIGEISRQLEKAKPGPKSGDTYAAQLTKERTLEQVGISLRTAERYEELSSLRE